MTDQTYERLRGKLKLDPLELDQELIELPMLILEASEKTSYALADRDKMKNHLDVTMAETADHLRRELITDSKNNPKQRSEAQIESELPLFESVQNAQKDLEHAKLELALWQAMCDSLRTKRDSLKTFADLTISGYLSPNVAIDQRRAEIRAASTSPRRRLVNPQ